MKTPAIASSLSAVTPSRIREIDDIAFAVVGATRCTSGNPTSLTPTSIREVAVRALEEG